MYAILLDVSLENTRHFTVNKSLISIFALLFFLFVAFFFSEVWLRGISDFLDNFKRRIGVRSATRDYVMQKFMYQHQRSILTLFYRTVNKMLTALGLHRKGITVTGYILFDLFITLIASLVFKFLAGFSFMFSFALWITFAICFLVGTRVRVSGRIENRERDIMNAIDLIVPELGNGVKNAINAYVDNFAPSVKEEFQSFLSNINDKGLSFEESMYILSDELGGIFLDFAQKAIYYEKSGDPEMLMIFTDITETNRLRRQLRDDNNAAFTGLTATFLISVGMVVGYFVFLMFTDSFSRHFFLQTAIGNYSILIILGIVFGVLAYISIIKSKAI